MNPKEGDFALSNRIGRYSYEEYLSAVESFHGYAAPGLMMGGFMVDMALRRMPEGVLFDAVCETLSCLPDAVQLLTPCTMGNGWLRVLNLGRYAVSLFDKMEGGGVRVHVDAQKVKEWPAVETWFFKLKPKSEQDSARLLEEIRMAGRDLYRMEPVRMQARLLKRRHKGKIGTCKMCGEPYPVDDGAICRACRGEAPYEAAISHEAARPGPMLRSIPVEDAVGKIALHDMTRIEAGKSKGAAFIRGQTISAGDLCRLQQMGRQRVYVEEENSPESEWVHENEAALAFSKAMAGEGVHAPNPPREGKVDLLALRDGLLVVDEERLEAFNMVPGVMCASRKSYSMASEGRSLAGTRAIPLYLPKGDFSRAMSLLADGPLFRVLPLKKAKVGILVTGSEVFQGLIEDRFIPILGAKVEALGCSVVKAIIAPDEREAIAKGARELIACGAEIVLTTAGLSVDPDDVTRQALVDAGAEEMVYGAPVLPGANILLARIGSVRVMGVPACALYFSITGFDLLFPRLLAGLDIGRRDLAKLGHGSFCLACKSCTFPKCPFGG